MQKPNIFEYISYREFFLEVADYLKALNGMSFRQISSTLGFSSPNYWQQICKGDRSFNLKHIDAFSELFELSKTEQDFLSTIVKFENEKTPKFKLKFLHEIQEHRKRENILTLEDDLLEFFSTWYMPVVWELSVHPLFEDIDWIIQQVRPKITRSQVKSALNKLQKLNLIQSSKNGWTRTHHSIKTSSKIKSLAAIDYHKSMLAKAEFALENYDSSQRKLMSLMIGASEEKMTEISSR